MKRVPVEQIRQTFLDFFRAKGHEVVPSSALVPANDPTLLFTNSGMVQFKDVFTQKERRPYVRATTAQKCIRAGGKHNDLENVGFTARHHTFFEMLGNFSFGDYFKKEAIDAAWTLMTEVLAISKDRLCVTIFKGEMGIPADDEAAGFWRAVGVPENRIFRLGKADNYWQMGDSGPQGPCSEIHYFLGDDLSQALDPGRVERSEGWFEIWNLVFMQFFKETADGPLLPLPKPSIDTGAGLERLAVVLQGQRSNYDTDAFLPLLEHISSSVKKEYRRSAEMDDVSMRVIADHARATAFLIADGVQPSNEKRGYVLRRIMRRAIRHGSRLGFDDLFFDRVCQKVVDQMSPYYPELKTAAPLIQKVAQNEERGFRQTLERGLKILKKRIDTQKSGEIDPSFVAMMWDTYGFPIDLTRVIAMEHGLLVDEEKAKEANPQPATDDHELGASKAIEAIWFSVRDQVGPTEFLGYEKDQAPAKVLALVHQGRSVRRLDQGQEGFVVLDRTPFYGESGGQVGDRGELSAPGLTMEISDTQKPRSDLVAHLGRITAGSLEVGSSVEAKVQAGLRNATRKNHSATHILHLVLKEVLGTHVQQKGSLVAPDRLRFDYSHFEPVSREQMAEIERRVNQRVLDDAPTVTEVHGLQEAKAAGAVMLFGEKYSDRVRMVRIGGDSLELCGGTHVKRAGEIGLVKIVSDSALASGIRRLEAVTGLSALAFVQDKLRLLDASAQLFRSSADELPERIERVLRRNKELEKELERAQASAALGGAESADPLDCLEEVGGLKVLAKKLPGTPVKAMRDISDQLKDRLKSGVVILGTTEGEKAALLVVVTKDLLARIHAGKIVQEAAMKMEGKGGGRPDFAQGGGKAELLDAGMARAKEALAEAATRPA